MIYSKILSIGTFFAIFFFFIHAVDQPLAETAPVGSRFEKFWNLVQDKTSAGKKWLTKKWNSLSGIEIIGLGLGFSALSNFVYQSLKKKSSVETDGQSDENHSLQSATILDEPPQENEPVENIAYEFFENILNTYPPVSEDAGNPNRYIEDMLNTIQNGTALTFQGQDGTPLYQMIGQKPCLDKSGNVISGCIQTDWIKATDNNRRAQSLTLSITNNCRWLIEYIANLINSLTIAGLNGQENPLHLHLKFKNWLINEPDLQNFCILDSLKNPRYFEEVRTLIGPIPQTDLKTFFDEEMSPPLQVFIITKVNPEYLIINFFKISEPEILINMPIFCKSSDFLTELTTQWDNMANPSSSLSTSY